MSQARLRHARHGAGAAFCCTRFRSIGACGPRSWRARQRRAARGRRRSARLRRVAAVGRADRRRAGRRRGRAARRARRADGVGVRLVDGRLRGAGDRGAAQGAAGGAGARRHARGRRLATWRGRRARRRCGRCATTGRPRSSTACPSACCRGTRSTICASACAICASIARRRSWRRRGRWRIGPIARRCWRRSTARRWSCAAARIPRRRRRRCARWPRRSPTPSTSRSRAPGTCRTSRRPIAFDEAVARFLAAHDL